MQTTIPEVEMRLKFRPGRGAIGRAPESLADLAQVFRWMEELPYESLVVVSFDARNRIRHYHQVAIGSVNRVGAPMRDIIRPVLCTNSPAMALVHNHPSGNPTPSAEDRELTRQTRRACAILGITFHDHLIVAAEGTWSFQHRRTF